MARRHLPRASALLVSAALALATLAAVPASAEPAPEHRDRWRQRDRDRHWDRHDHRRDRHDHRRDRHDRWDRHGDRDRHERWHDDRRWDRHDHWRDERRFDRDFRIPTRIRSFLEFERYDYGRVYDREHRHHHRVLAFPDPYGPSYRPYAYCGDSLYSSGAFYYDGPRLSIRWRF